MSTTYNDLTDRQKKQHEEALKKAGIDRASVAKKVTTDKPHNHIQDAKMKIHKVKIKDLAHLKELGGVPDSRYTAENQSDSHLEYPAPPSADRFRALSALRDSDSLQAAFTPEEANAVKLSMRAHTLGDSTKVAKEWVQLANAAHFPTEGAIAAADDLTITKPYVISAPPDKQKLIVGVLTIVQPEGQIISNGVDLAIEAQQIVVR